jgi:hypothetical protein
MRARLGFSGAIESNVAPVLVGAQPISMASTPIASGTRQNRIVALIRKPMGPPQAASHAELISRPSPFP